MKGRRLAAIMFVDIVGYTATMHEDESKAYSQREKLKLHFRATIDQHQGRIIQFYGDGFLSTFDSSWNAINCATEFQSQMLTDPIVPVRIGIHLGEVVESDGGIFGDAVNVASRIESIASPGSILFSSKVHDEIKNKKDIKVKDLGDVKFKNVKNTIKIFAVDSHKVMVPESIDRSGKIDKDDDKEKIWSIPQFPNEFIGREKDVEAISRLFASHECRLLTILGSGGLGKTRLAAKVAETIGSLFSNGCVFIGLEAVENTRLIPQILGTELGLTENSQTSWEDQVYLSLRDKHLLLVMDNLEQVIEVKHFINQLLKECTSVKVLSTSRRTLQIPGEFEYPLQPMKTFSTHDLDHTDLLLETDSVQLFLQKARQVKPNFRPDEKSIREIAEICSYLEGMPLALELAASRIKLFSPAMMKKQVLRIFKFLEKKTSGDVHRHSKIWETIKWSYDLLDDSEKRAFEALSIFPEGFSFESLEAILPSHDPWDLVEMLLNNSLIKRIEDHDTPRFRMSKVIREFGLNYLLNSPEYAAVQGNYINYFQQFAKDHDFSKKQGLLEEHMVSIDAEAGNIRDVFQYLKKTNTTAAKKFGIHLWKYFLNRGLLREGYEEIKSLLALPSDEMELRARILNACGTLAHNTGHYHESQTHYQESLAIWRSLNKKYEIAVTLNHLGWASFRFGEYNHGLSYSYDAFHIAKELGDDQIIVKSLNNIAWMFMFKGHIGSCIKIQDHLIRINARLGNEPGLAFARINCAWAKIWSGKIESVESSLTEASLTFEKLLNDQLLAFTRFIKSELFLSKSEPQKALEILNDQCIPLFAKIGDLWAEAFSYQVRSMAHHMEGQTEKAFSDAEKSISIRKITSDKWGLCKSRILVAQLHISTKNYELAEEILKDCVQITEAMEYLILEKECHESLCLVYEKQGDQTKSKICRERCSLLLTKMPEHPEMYHALVSSNF